MGDQLTFREHLNNLCHYASYKLDALCKISKYLTLDKVKLFCLGFEIASSILVQ